MMWRKSDLKKGLVCSGGGSAGAYGVGVLKALLESGKTYDIICGTSVGSLNGSFIAHFKPHEQKYGISKLIQIWSKIENETIFKPQAWWIFKFIWGLWKRSINTMAPLKALIDKNLNKEQLNSSGVQLRVGCCSLNSGKYKSASGSEPNINEWIYASCIFPALFEPIEIDGELWVDGGIRNAIPVKDAIELGATEIDVILTQPSTGYIQYQDEKDLKKFYDVGLRVAQIMSDQVYIDNLIQRGNVKITIYQPSEIEQTPGFEFNQKDIQRMIEQGYIDTKIRLMGEQE